MCERMSLSLYSNDPGKVILLSFNNYKAPAFKLLKSLPNEEGFFIPKLSVSNSDRIIKI